MSLRQDVAFCYHNNETTHVQLAKHIFLLGHVSRHDLSFGSQEYVTAQKNNIYIVEYSE